MGGFAYAQRPLMVLLSASPASAYGHLLNCLDPLLWRSDSDLQIACANKTLHRRPWSTRVCAYLLLLYILSATIARTVCSSLYNVAPPDF